MKITCVFEGGIGQNFIATAVTRLLRVKYPESKIYVIASYKDIFANNPDVNGAIDLGNQKAFDNYVKGCDLFYHKHLYREMDVSKNPQHIIKTFVELHDLIYDDKGISYYPTQLELDKAKQLYDSFESKKPKILFQPLSIGNDKNWIYGNIQKLINDSVDYIQWIYVNSHDGNCNSYTPYNCFNLLNVELRDLAPLVKYSDGLVCIDSCLQHIAGGLYKKRAVMLMGRSNVKYYAWNTTSTIACPESCQDFGCERPRPFQIDKCHHRSCMYAITPHKVLEVIKNKLL